MQALALLDAPRDPDPCEGTWADDGLALLSSAWDRLSAKGLLDLRVVSAQADELKVAMLVAIGLRLVEQWWVKPIEARDAPGVPAGRVDGPGFSGLLGPAPPVYDPGGPVLLADCVAVDGDLAVIEDEAARMGSVLVLIPTEPGSDRERVFQHGRHPRCGFHFRQQQIGQLPEISSAACARSSIASSGSLVRRRNGMA